MVDYKQFVYVIWQPFNILCNSLHQKVKKFTRLWRCQIRKREYVAIRLAHRYVHSSDI